LIKKQLVYFEDDFFMESLISVYFEDDFNMIVFLIY